MLNGFIYMYILYGLFFHPPSTLPEREHYWTMQQNIQTDSDSIHILLFICAQLLWVIMNQSHTSMC